MRRKKSQKSDPLVGRVIRHIDKMIGRGELKPGQRIRESEIGAKLQVGRVPVREAIRFLAGAGIAELVPNSGARVRLASIGDIIDMLVVQNGLMVLAAEIMIARDDFPANLETLKRITDRIARTPASASSITLIQLFGRFHWHILKSCGNAALTQIALNGRFNHYRIYLTEIADHSVFVTSQPRFPLMADALARHDLATFKRLADEQVVRVREYAVTHQPAVAAEP